MIDCVRSPIGVRHGELVMATFKCFSCSKSRTEEEMQRCARCKSVWYCVRTSPSHLCFSFHVLSQSRECQVAHWKVHKPFCKEAADPNVPAMAVIVPCEGEKTSGLFHTVQLHTTHEIHRLGSLSPISQLVGLPIVLFRHLGTDAFATPNNPSLDNRIATHLMIDPDTGFAPLQ